MANSTAALERAIRAVEALVDQPAVSDRDLLRRFAEEDDQRAFAALVRRYTGLVLGVCRRALGNVQDAEDACQATFLVLARKAKAGRWRQSVANWLFTTARRVSSNARVAADRRAKREGRAVVRETVSPADQVTGRELLAALDEELERLSPRYREPLVLCYLEGLTRDEVATRLGVAASTVKTQLERGRKKLGDALTKRGCGLGAGLLALAVTSPAGASPPRLVQAVLATVSGSPPEAVAALAREVTVNALVKKTIPAVLAAAVLLGGVGVALKLSAAGQPAAKAAPATAAAREKPKSPENEATITFKGRVVGPDGRPVAGAKLYLSHGGGYYKRPDPAPESGTAGVDGRFAFTAPRPPYGQRWVVLAATGPGLGVGWAHVPLGRRPDEVTVRLVRDDVPITGQIVDLEGKPVRGATLTVLQINAALGEDLGPWVEAAKAKKGRALDLEQKYLGRYTVALSPVVRTDAAGRFRLDGIGRDRLVRAQLDGPGIASQPLCILTRPGKPIELIYHKSDREDGHGTEITTYHGADFRYAAAPDKPIVGVVRDKDTKRPLAGVTIQSEKFAYSVFHGMEIVRTTTDAQGRYRLRGMPKGDGNKIKLVPPNDLPYLAALTAVPDTAGLDPVTVDFELKRGVWIEGKLTDKATGKPVRGAVEYFSMYANPNLVDHPKFIAAGFRILGTKEDGSYRVVGIPGPGLVGVYAMSEHYLRAPDRDDEFGTTKQSLSTAPFHISFTSNYRALARIDPPKGAESVRRDVTLDPGWAFKATVLGPDGAPLPGARTFDLHGKDWWTREPLKTAEFGGWFHPRLRRETLLKHAEKGLVGVATPPKENGGLVTVTMRPGAAVTGRLLDAAGKPRAGVEVEVSFRPKGSKYWYDDYPERIHTDREGRFRVEAMLPGYEYGVSDGRDEYVIGTAPRSGETKDVGDVRMKPEEE